MNPAASVQHAHDAFISRFGQRPTHGAIAPGRVNLIGEHTDYNEGFVMPLAIDRHTIVLARPVTDSQSMIWAKDLDDSLQVDLTSALKPIGGSFADYILAVSQQFQMRGHSLPNMQMLITGDIPRGAGLSSSASLEVAAATLFEAVTDSALPPLQKALLCQAAEQQFVGVPCGIMDMFIITMAQRQTAMLIDCRSHEHQAVPLPSSQEAALLVVDTGVERSLRHGAYGERRRTCAATAEKLGVRSLRDASPEHVEGCVQLTQTERRCGLHVVNENMRVLAGAQALRRGDLSRFGELMFASHDSLRDLYEVTIPELDAVVRAARALLDRGVLGARMTGAGFGGCAIVLCTPSSASVVKYEIRCAFNQQFAREPGIFDVTAVGGAHRLEVGSL